MTELNAQLLSRWISAQPRQALAAVRPLAADARSNFVRALNARELAQLVGVADSWSLRWISDSCADSQLAECLEELAFSHSARRLLMVRLEGDRERLLSVLPAKLAQRLRRRLLVPDDRVGSWCDMRAPAAFTGETLADLSARLADADESGVLYVVNENGELAGSVLWSALAAQPPERTLQSLTLQPVQALSDFMILSSALHERDWAAHASFPVVDDQNVLVGALRFRTLLEALGEMPEEQTAEPLRVVEALLSSWLSLVSVGFRSAGAGLAGGATNPTDSITRNSGRGSIDARPDDLSQRDST